MEEIHFRFIKRVGCVHGTADMGNGIHGFKSRTLCAIVGERRKREFGIGCGAQNLGGLID